MSDDKLITSAVCGLFCQSCGLYIASQEDENRLKNLAAKFGKSTEEIRCDGCRSERLGPMCHSCEFKSCTKLKNILFCSECSEYPCKKLEEFQQQSQFAHRLELMASLNELKNSGHQQWYQNMLARYSCKVCGTVNSAYDINCRKCDVFPSNPYVEENITEIKRRTRK